MTARICRKNWSSGFVALLTAATAIGGEIEIVEGIPPGYELVRLTDDPTMEHSVPDINDAGEVVFGKFVTGVLPLNTYLFSGGRVSNHTTDETLDFDPIINNESQIAWLRAQTLAGPIELLTTYTNEALDGDADPVGFIDMNDHGDIVWQHRRQVGVSEFDIYLYTHADGNVTQLTDGGNNQSARINNVGQLAWTTFDFSVQPWIGHIMLYSDGMISEITPEACECQEPDINDLGHVVWQDAGGIQFWNGETLATIAEIASTPRINNMDEIALSKWSDTLQLWQHSIFKDEVLYVLPAMGMTNSRRNLNNRGELAMRYRDLNTGHKELFLLRREGPDGDGNYDCRIDNRDFQLIQICRTALPGPEGSLLADCIRFDFDDDGDVDLSDYKSFLVVFTGPDGNVPDCEPA